ncbi:MAG: hypothetical protein Q4B59_02555 [Lachnospiraceae bacterium]|nr:hypothetical protein [Lachnospiraceae bacterium]
MNKLRRILALIGVIVIAVLFLTTCILGLFGSPDTKDLFMASLAALVIVPGLLYAMLLVAKILQDRHDQ